jgi:hypothetical protein
MILDRERGDLPGSDGGLDHERRHFVWFDWLIWSWRCSWRCKGLLWEDLSNACVWLLDGACDCWWWELIESRTPSLYSLSWGLYRRIPNWLQVDCRYSELTVDQWCCFWWCHSELDWSSPAHCHFGRCRFVPEPERRVSTQPWIRMYG